MFMRSERLFLRPAWPEDEEARSGIGGSIVAGQLAVPVQEWLEEARPGRFPRFLVTLPGSHGSRVIGCAGLQRGACDTELVSWIAPEHQGQGFATEAGRAMLRLARTLGHRALAALHPDVPAARRLMEKLCFRPTGERLQRLCPTRGEPVSLLVNRREFGNQSDCGGMGDNLQAA